MTGAVELEARPQLRGVSHLAACPAFAGLGLALVLVAQSGRATVACAVYAASVAGLFGTSATYHRVRWTRASAQRWMRRVDHSMIFVLIAGSYTPFALLVLEGTLAVVILAVVWGGALGGVVLKLAWLDAPAAVTSGVYVALGWVAVVAGPALLAEIGVVGTVMVGAGGVLYTVGAVIYARHRPDPAPLVFGYHEIFHLLVIAAAGLQFAVVAFWVVPGA